TWSLLGKKGKIIHAAVTLTGIFTDNAFNAKENRKSDFSMFLTPEIWLNLPRTDKAVSPGGLSPSSAGGHLLDSLLGERLFGYQASLYYRTDLPLIASKTSPYGNTATHRIGAGLALIGNRISLNLSDQFEKSYQEREAGQIIRTDTRDRYDANRFNATVTYDTRNRLILSLDYVNFITNFQSATGEALDRRDYGLTPSVRYRLTPKINLLAEYTYLVVSYDSNSSLDSTENYLLAGIEWRLTEKSFGRLKAGYETKDFSKGSQYRGSSFELQAEHRLTPKTQLSLSSYRKTNETRVAGTAFTISTGVRLSISNMITSKITAALKLSYLNDKYKGTSPSSLSETAVNDNIYQAGIEVQYAFRRWLRARAEYLFTLKNSSDPAFDYRSNTLLFGLTGSF
ncbi:MAG: outer membrane beta-barrel protein, partial [Nitrospirota bacterium]|nr:outer membrane beta-barrel protein [Nitrospirota bacterium]